MEKQKNHEKGKIDSSSSDTVLQSRRKKRRDEYNNDAISSINNDVLEEIMLRLPVKALVRFQIVSKHWKRTIKSKSFMDRHTLHEKTLEPKIICLYEEDENGCDGDNLTTLTTFRLDWSCSTTCLVEEGLVRLINPQSKKRNRGYSSCDGLVCFFYGDILKTPIIVTNPATGQSQFLPLSMIQQQYLDKKMQHAKVVEPVPGFGKDSVTGTYKIVWLHDHPKNNILSCEVFDFEVKMWRYVTMDTPYAIFGCKRPTFANGWIYWLTENKTILAYNLHTEIFRVIMHKVLSQASWIRFIRMCSLNDFLWITDMKGDENGIQDFWRIKNVSGLEWEWEKMFSIDSTLIFPWFPKEDSSVSCLTLMAISKDNKKVLVSKACCSSKVVQLLIHPTFLVFLSIFSGPCHREFVPYFQNLDFPL